ncbi:hypothetical protein [Cellulomonas taurus]|uniref:hypothetical protein n=1 Tax=Cellulomonas taurus TaxID=2729175 RepID=UPI00145F5B44|nr:hypothetical protein [Cellulomonas taurus]
MIWWLLWAVLVIGTLVGAFFLGRSLWRKGRALLVELDRAATVLGELAETTGRLAEEAREAERAALAAAQALPTRESARAQWAANRKRIEGRKAARAIRDAATRERWRDLSR